VVLPIYEVKGDVVFGSYIGIKWLEHAMKVLERIIKCRIQQQIDIDMQFGFVKRKGTTDSIFILRQMQKFISKGKKLYYSFVDL